MLQSMGSQLEGKKKKLTNSGSRRLEWEPLVGKYVPFLDLSWAYEGTISYLHRHNQPGPRNLLRGGNKVYKRGKPK